MAHRRIPLPEKICKCGCGLSFIPYRDWQQFYSPEHRSEYYWRTHEVITKEPEPLNQEETKSEKIAG